MRPTASLAHMTKEGGCGRRFWTLHSPRTQLQVQILMQPVQTWPLLQDARCRALAVNTSLLFSRFPTCIGKESALRTAQAAASLLDLAEGEADARVLHVPALGDRVLPVLLHVACTSMPPVMQELQPSQFGAEVDLNAEPGPSSEKAQALQQINSGRPRIRAYPTQVTFATGNAASPLCLPQHGWRNQWHSLHQSASDRPAMHCSTQVQQQRSAYKWQA